MKHTDNRGTWDVSAVTKVIHTFFIQTRFKHRIDKGNNTNIDISIPAGLISTTFVVDLKLHNKIYCLVSVVLIFILFMTVTDD